MEVDALAVLRASSQVYGNDVALRNGEVLHRCGSNTLNDQGGKLLACDSDFENLAAQLAGPHCPLLVVAVRATSLC